MNIRSLFAIRYLFSRKSHSIINIVSGVSSLSVAIPAMAMIILLSVSNGFNTVIKSLYKNFDPDIKISADIGKFFDPNQIPISKIREIDEVRAVALTIEENALFSSEHSQQIGIMLGVDTSYVGVVPIDARTTKGLYTIENEEEFQRAFVGEGIAYALGMGGTNFVQPMEIYVPKKGTVNSILPMEYYKRGIISPSGTFSVDADIDATYVLVPLTFAQKLIGAEDKVSSVIVSVNSEDKIDLVRDKIKSMVPKEFNVENRYQQKKEFYRILVYEKWGIYLIILLVLIIASFSIAGSLAMIIIDKKPDIATIATIGGNMNFIRSIFIREGMLISGIGSVLGITLGIIIVIIQQQFGIIKLGGSTFMIDAYPVELKIVDLIGVLITIFMVNYIISTVTVYKMIDKKVIINPKENN